MHDRNILLLTVLYFTIGGLGFFEFTESYHLLMTQLEIATLSAIAYVSMGLTNNNVKSRSIIISLLMYNVYVFATDWAFDYVSPVQWFAEIVAFCALTVYQIFKRYNYKSDVYNPDTIMLAFYRPKKFSESFHTVVGAPVSSMSVISGNDWYMFRRKESGLCKESVAIRKLSDYVLIDTSHKITQNTTKELDALVGTSARSYRTLYIRGRCVSTFKGFLNGMGIKWRLGAFDYIPSIYMMKRLRDEGTNKRGGN